MNNKSLISWNTAKDRNFAVTLNSICKLFFMAKPCYIVQDDASHCCAFFEIHVAFDKCGNTPCHTGSVYHKYNGSLEKSGKMG